MNFVVLTFFDPNQPSNALNKDAQKDKSAKPPKAITSETYDIDEPTSDSELDSIAIDPYGVTTTSDDNPIEHKDSGKNVEDFEPMVKEEKPLEMKQQQSLTDSNGGDKPESTLHSEGLENSPSSVSEKENLTSPKNKESKAADLRKYEDSILSDDAIIDIKPGEPKKGKRSRTSKELIFHEAKKQKDAKSSGIDDNDFDINFIDQSDAPKLKLEDFEDEEVDGIYDRLTEDNRRLLFKEIIKRHPESIELWYQVSDSSDNLRNSVSQHMESLEKKLLDAQKPDFEYDILEASLLSMSNLLY